MQNFEAMSDCFEKNVHVEACEPSSIGAIEEHNRGRSLLSSHALYGRYDRSRQVETTLDSLLERLQLPSDPQICVSLGIEQFHESEVLRLHYRSRAFLPLSFL